jgi:hypothetical protein
MIWICGKHICFVQELLLESEKAPLCFTDELPLSQSGMKKRTAITFTSSI